MKKQLLTLSVAVLLAQAPASAHESVAADSIRAVADIEEVVIIASPKENVRLRQKPLSFTLLSQQALQQNRIHSLKQVSGLVPNLFVPDYGSKLTSAIYIRGIGARTGTPAVGMYVDDVPYLDKSAFDFDLADIERIDVLRGPQSTLYGRNTMGGLLNIHTRSPFTYQGTDLNLSAATRGDYRASLTHYHRASERFAFSTGGFYQYHDGFFKNQNPGVDKKADRLSSGGGRVRAIYRPNESLRLDLTANYEYTDQGGYAYGLYDTKAGTIADVNYNDPSSYRRSLLTTGLNLRYEAEHYTLSAVTGYQNLRDRMFLDQDFTPADMFNLTQKQRINTLSEEVVFKSQPGRRWQWTTGVFGFYQWLHTDGPVDFKKDFMANLQAVMDKAMASRPVKVTLGDRMHVDGSYDTPTAGVAAYHQSTIDDLFVRGLSLTVGLRLDYEHTRLRHQTGGTLPATMQMPGMPMAVDASRSIQLADTLSAGYLQLLPKFSLQYRFDRDCNVYATVSKGHRSGGYNIQMFSDILQSQMSSPQGGATNEKPVTQESVGYKPEYSWNYEVGTHLAFWQRRLCADLSAFFMDTHDQQIARFSENGFGRMTVNAGRSRSIGMEAALEAQITQGLHLQASYGLTHATFRDYQTNRQVTNRETGKKEVQTLDYSGNYVPFVPRHTFSAGAAYTFGFNRRAVRSLTLSAHYQGIGRIYWTEQNDAEQPFYGTLHARASLQLKPMQIDLWASNILGQDYTAFYFESMGKPFGQKGNPCQVGIDLRFHL